MKAAARKIHGHDCEKERTDPKHDLARADPLDTAELFFGKGAAELEPGLLLTHSLSFFSWHNARLQPPAARKARIEHDSRVEGAVGRLKAAVSQLLRKAVAIHGFD